MPVLPAFGMFLQYGVKGHLFVKFKRRELYAQRLNCLVVQRKLGIGVIVYAYGYLLPLPAEVLGYFFLQLYEVQQQLFRNVDVLGNKAGYIWPYLLHVLEIGRA